MKKGEFNFRIFLICVFNSFFVFCLGNKLVVNTKTDYVYLII